jgi:hypothetical protein
MENNRIPHIFAWIEGFIVLLFEKCMEIMYIRHVIRVVIVRLLVCFEIQIKMNFLNMWLHSKGLL